MDKARDLPEIISLWMDTLTDARPWLCPVTNKRAPTVQALTWDRHWAKGFNEIAEQPRCPGEESKAPRGPGHTDWKWQNGNGKPDGWIWKVSFSSWAWDFVQKEDRAIRLQPKQTRGQNASFEEQFCCLSTDTGSFMHTSPTNYISKIQKKIIKFFYSFL